MTRRFEGQVVWITGGGSGLGREIALEYGRRGAVVVVSGRRLDRLEDVAAQVNSTGGTAFALECDVTDESAVQSCVDSMIARHGRLDIAVANAGFSVAGRVEDLTAEDWRRQFDTNVVGLAVTARHALPHLRATGGRLALIGSVAGTVVFPGVGAYHASKYAVRAIGQVLAMELEGTGVSCTTIQPGFVKSEIAQVDNDGRYHADWDDKRPQPLMWDTDKAARVVVEAIARREREFTFTAHGRAAAFLGKHAPGFVHLVVTKLGGGYKRR